MSERKVLKVNGSSQEMPMENMPPMDMSQDMGDNMGGQFPQGNDMQAMPMDNEMGDTPNQFDTNFDAGVEANEEEDPKKFIQQLTGKLSQSLKTYNDQNGQPDVDLNKYVAGMIVKQAIKGLSQEDTEDIINKIKSDEDFDLQDNSKEQEMPNGDEQMMAQGQQMPQNQNLQEKRFSKANKQIQEIVDGVLNNRKDNEKSSPYQPKSDNDGFTSKPYRSPNFNY